MVTVSTGALPAIIILAGIFIVGVSLIFLLVSNLGDKEHKKLNYAIAGIDVVVIIAMAVSVIYLNSATTVTKEDIDELTAVMDNTDDGCMVISAPEETYEDNIRDCEDLVLNDGYTVVTVADGQQYTIRYDENFVTGTKVTVERAG